MRLLLHFSHTRGRAAADTSPIEIQEADLWYNHGEIKKGDADSE